MGGRQEDQLRQQNLLVKIRHFTEKISQTKENKKNKSKDGVKKLITYKKKTQHQS